MGFLEDFFRDVFFRGLRVPDLTLAFVLVLAFVVGFLRVLFPRRDLPPPIRSSGKSFISMSVRRLFQKHRRRCPSNSSGEGVACNEYKLWLVYVCLMKAHCPAGCVERS